MNEVMKGKIIASLEKIASWIEEAEAFAREQAPLIVQEILDYGMAKELIQCLVPFCFFLACGTFVIIALRKGKKLEWYRTGENWAIAAGAVSFVGLFLFIVSTVEFVDVLKVYLAPRVYVLEQLRYLF